MALVGNMLRLALHNVTFIRGSSSHSFASQLNLTTFYCLA
jgi:hypothetical protein